MKYYLNTLYVSTQESYLAKEDEYVTVYHGGSFKGKAPVKGLEGVVLFGKISCSPFLLEHCADNNVAVSWFTESGHFLSSIHGDKVSLRRAQLRKSNSPEASASIARAITTGKIANCRAMLRRAERELPYERLNDACEGLSLCLGKLEPGLPLNRVREIEDEAMDFYFAAFPLLISNKDEAFVFTDRNRRPPLDAVNCLLTFLYGLLAQDVRSVLESVGLDTALGFMHPYKPGSPGLALDLMEELRPCLADRLACILINSGQVKAKGFKKLEFGAVSMDDDTRKEVAAIWQKCKQEELGHPLLKEKITVGLLLHVQARLLARHMRGDMEAYLPFLLR